MWDCGAIFSCPYGSDICVLFISEVFFFIVGWRVCSGRRLALSRVIKQALMSTVWWSLVIEGVEIMVEAMTNVHDNTTRFGPKRSAIFRTM